MLHIPQNIIIIFVFLLGDIEMKYIEGVLTEGEFTVGIATMVRTESMGVFAGELMWRSGDEAHLKNARRIWRWEGASSLSQLAIDGTSNPSGCKFPVEVGEVILVGAKELIKMTKKAVDSINSVPVWKS
jgi:hypothetical protein